MSKEMKKIGQDLKNGDTRSAQAKLKKLADELAKQPISMTLIKEIRKWQTSKKKSAN